MMRPYGHATKALKETRLIAKFKLSKEWEAISNVFLAVNGMKNLIGDVHLIGEIQEYTGQYL